MTRRTAYTPPRPEPETPRSAAAAPVPYTSSTLTLIAVGGHPEVVYARSLEAKRKLVHQALARRSALKPPDEVHLLAAWPGRMSQDIFEVDDLDRAWEALKPPPTAAEREATQLRDRLDALVDSGFTRDEAVAIIAGGTDIDVPLRRGW